MLGTKRQKKAGTEIEKRRWIWYAFFVGSFRRALEERYKADGTAVMGVLNATPDSFYDGGHHDGTKAIARVGELAEAGAFVIDIGGESTRPGATAVSVQEQLERIEPAVRAAVRCARTGTGCWVSVDTTEPRVAEVVLGWGVHVINDVSCLADADLARVTARANAALLLMHARGPMAQMAGFSEYPEDGYNDLLRDTMREWSMARERAIGQGLSTEDILFDPGIGFAKNATQSLRLLCSIEAFRALGAPIVVGPSRKSFFNLVQATAPGQRLGASIAACLYAAEHGVMMVRMHDVAVARQALMAQRLFRGQQFPALSPGVTEVACSTAS